MIILDANILLYAYVPTFEQHVVTKRWLEDVVSARDQIIGLPWQTINAFLRIGTNPRIFDEPFSIVQANKSLSKLIKQTFVEIVNPTDDHWSIFSKVLVEGQATADLVMDAHLAAIAIEHGSILATTDRDFSRFSNLKTINPLK